MPANGRWDLIRRLKVKSRICHNKSSIQKKIIVNIRLDVNLRNKLVKCNIKITALFGAENLTLRKADHNYIESSEVWCWRKVQKISWRSITLRQGRKEHTNTHTTKGSPTGLVTSCIGTAVWSILLKGRSKGR